MTQPGPRKLHFVAGGIGITPILSMIAFAEQLGKPWTMVYTGRHRDSLPFLNELKRFGDRVIIRTDDQSGLPTADDLLPGVGRTTRCTAVARLRCSRCYSGASSKCPR